MCAQYRRMMAWVAFAAVFGGSAHAFDRWPASVQPFFLSALNVNLTTAAARYIGQFPIAVINHKQGSSVPPHAGGAERKQITALSAIKKANSSCETYFYLNSLIDFAELALHNEFVRAEAAGKNWWLKTDAGEYVLQRDGSHTFDWMVPEARAAWVKTALAALAITDIDGVFVDKAGGAGFRGLSPKRLQEWNDGHTSLIEELRNLTSKKLILNNVYLSPSFLPSIRAQKMQTLSLHSGAGQLFERWGESPDHDGLNLTADIMLLGKLHNEGLITLARGGGVTPGSADKPDPQLCANNLAAFLVAIEVPNLGYFSCEPDFRSSTSPYSGWMTLLSNPIYTYPLGAPVSAAAVNVTLEGDASRSSKGHVITRAFQTGTVAMLNVSSGKGCVKWGGSPERVSGICPQ